MKNMKKLLALLLITVLFLSGCASTQSLQKIETVELSVENYDQHSNPPPIVVLGSMEEFNKLKELLSESDDAIIKEYLNNAVKNCLENREELIAFFEMLDSLPIPFIPTCKVDAIAYWPGNDHYGFVNVLFESEKGERFSFYFRKHHDLKILGNVERNIEIVFDTSPQLFYQIEAENIKVFEYPGEKIPEQKLVEFLMDINGYYVLTGYRNESIENILEVTPEQIYADLTLGNINDVIWKYKVNGFKFDGNEWDFVEILNEETDESLQTEQIGADSEEQEWN